VRLSSLTLSGFMNYSSSTEVKFDVKSGRNVVIFVGRNGSGKTSILHAIRWVLYGVTSKDGKDITTESLYNKTALALSKSGQTSSNQMQVTLNWISDGDNYSLTRTASANKNNIETKSVLRGPKGEVISDAKTNEVVNQFLPKSIAHLFLFDGESLSAFRTMSSKGNSAKFIQSQIESTLSIPRLKATTVWLNGELDKESIQEDKSAKITEKASKIRKEIAELIEKKDIKTQEFEEAKAKSEQYGVLADQIEDKLGDFQTFKDLVADLRQSKENKKQLEESIEGTFEEVQSVLSASPWLPMASKLKSMQDEALISESESKRHAENLIKMNAKLQMYRESLNNAVCELCGSRDDHKKSDMELKIQNLLADIQAMELLTPSGGGEVLSSLAKLGFNKTTSSQVEALSQKVISKKAEKAAIETKITLIETELENFDAADDHDKLIEDFVRYTNLSASYKAQWNKIDLERDRIFGEIQSKQSELSKLGTISPQKSVALNSYRQLNSIFGLALDEYIDATRASVQNKASETLLELFPGAGFKGVEITDTYGANLLNSDGIVDVPSTGQETALSIALLDGLLRTTMSENDGFVLMDSPSGSLDELNRRNFFRWASKSKLQVTILVHTGEYNEESDKQYFKDSIGRMYKITAPLSCGDCNYVAEEVDVFENSKCPSCGSGNTKHQASRIEEKA